MNETSKKEMCRLFKQGKDPGREKKDLREKDSSR